MPATYTGAGTGTIFVANEDVGWYTLGTTTTTTTNITVDTWDVWNDHANEYRTIRTWQDESWNHWIQVGNSAPALATPVYSMDPAPQRTEEEWAAIREENNRLAAERDALKAAARAEARKLLEFVLTEAQLASYDQHKYFDVIGSAGTVFRVHHGTSGNVRQLVDGKEVNALCAHPNLYDSERGGYLPTEDCLAAQVLAIMHDESQFLTVANVHRGPRHLAAVPDLAEVAA